MPCKACLTPGVRGDVPSPPAHTLLTIGVLGVWVQGFGLGVGWWLFGVAGGGGVVLGWLCFVGVWVVGFVDASMVSVGVANGFVVLFSERFCSACSASWRGKGDGFGGFGGWWESLPQWVELTALAGSEPWRCVLVNRELFCWKAGW